MSAVFRRFAFVILLVLAAGACRAGTPDRIVEAFRHWMQTHGVRTGAIVVFQDGTPVRQLGVGVDVAAPVELASLSKAITGACVAAQVRAGRLAYGDTLQTRLGWPGPLGAITVAELLTQTSGLTEDVTQSLMGRWLDEPEPHWPAVGQAVLAGAGRLGTKTYRYNNVNYALLGLVLEAATGQGYADACAMVTKGFSSARLSPRTGGFAPWGGWTMTLADYGAFILKTVKPGLTRMPAASIGGGAFYGPGILWRRAGSGTNAWHQGLHCFPGRLETGSFVAAWNGAWTVTAVYGGCLTDAARNDLDQSLATAALGL